MTGWVYVFSNKAMPGLVKVGETSKEPEVRAKELDHTGSPHPPVVEYQMWTEEPYQIEQQTHRLLSAKREGKEWFRCSAEEAVAAIKQVAGPRAISETYQRAERTKAEALYQQKLEEQETRRKREKVEKDFDDWVRNEEATIREKFERQIAAPFLPRPFWEYWLSCGVLVAIALGILGIFEADIPVSAGLMLAIIGGGIAGFFLQEYVEKLPKHLIISLERQRDKELAAVRTREQSQPSKQAVAPIEKNLLAQLQKKADSGDVDAQVRLGRMYYNGHGVPQDYQEAIRWYHLAGEQGHAEAQFSLGNMYYRGEGVPKDATKAVEWYQKAAVQGIAVAQNNLGACTTRGRGYHGIMPWPICGQPLLRSRGMRILSRGWNFWRRKCRQSRLPRPNGWPGSGGRNPQSESFKDWGEEGLLSKGKG